MKPNLFGDGSGPLKFILAIALVYCDAFAVAPSVVGYLSHGVTSGESLVIVVSSLFVIAALALSRDKDSPGVKWPVMSLSAVYFAWGVVDIFTSFPSGIVSSALAVVVPFFCVWEVSVLGKKPEGEGTGHRNVRLNPGLFFLYVTMSLTLLLLVHWSLNGFPIKELFLIAGACVTSVFIIAWQIVPQISSMFGMLWNRRNVHGKPVNVNLAGYDFDEFVDGLLKEVDEFMPREESAPVVTYDRSAASSPEKPKVLGYDGGDKDEDRKPSLSDNAASQANGFEVFYPPVLNLAKNFVSYNNPLGIPNDKLAQVYNAIIELVIKSGRYVEPDMDLHKIAGELGVNSTYIYYALNRCGGTTFTRLRDRHRILHVMSIVASNPLIPPTDYVHQVGFNSYKTFLRAFKATAGISPSEWYKYVLMKKEKSLDGSYSGLASDVEKKLAEADLQNIQVLHDYPGDGDSLKNEADDSKENKYPEVTDTFSVKCKPKEKESTTAISTSVPETGRTVGKAKIESKKDTSAKASAKKKASASSRTESHKKEVYMKATSFAEAFADLDMEEFLGEKNADEPSGRNRKSGKVSAKKKESTSSLRTKAGKRISESQVKA